MNSKTQSSRPDLYVIARIIKILKEKNKLNKTALATSTGLAYDKFIRYLDWMLKEGFVVIDEEGLVALTADGLKAYDELVRWIMKHVGQLRFPRLRLSL